MGLRHAFRCRCTARGAVARRVRGWISHATCACCCCCCCGCGCGGGCCCAMATTSRGGKFAVHTRRQHLVLLLHLQQHGGVERQRGDGGVCSGFGLGAEALGLEVGHRCLCGSGQMRAPCSLVCHMCQGRLCPRIWQADTAEVRRSHGRGTGVGASCCCACRCRHRATCIHPRATNACRSAGAHLRQCLVQRQPLGRLEHRDGWSRVILTQPRHVPVARPRSLRAVVRLRCAWRLLLTTGLLLLLLLLLLLHLLLRVYLLSCVRPTGPADAPRVAVCGGVWAHTLCASRRVGAGMAFLLRHTGPRRLGGCTLRVCCP